MGPLSERSPKPMLPVGQKPLAARVADAAITAGADELVLVTGYRGKAVRGYFGDEYGGVPVRYARQDDPQGTADALRVASDVLDGKFAVLNGDNLYRDADLRELFANGPGIGGYRVDNPTEYGVLSTSQKRVTGIVEKPDQPPSELVNAGAYVFPSEAVGHLDVPKSERGEYELTDVLDRLLDDHWFELVELDRWLDVGRPWELLEANALALDEQDRSIGGEVHPDATVEGNVVVEPGATVESGVTIEGPVRVRSGATVGPNAYVRGATLLGENVNVGHSVEVKNSLIMEGAAVPHLSYVGDSVVGEDANLGAGTVVANLRHDDDPVKVTVKGERVSTDRRKFGVVVGPGAKTGINTSICPGVTLSAGATTDPGETVWKDR